MSKPARAEALIFFLPLSVPNPIESSGVEPAILARRLPDFLHHLFNRGGPGPTGMLEVQTPPGEEPVRWLTLTDVPEPSDVFAMLAETEPADAIVAGRLGTVDDRVFIELDVHFANPSDDRTSATVRGMLRHDHPVEDICAIAERLADVLGIRYPGSNDVLLTQSSRAFFKYLEGLDGAALLTGDPELEPERNGSELLAPFADALSLDPTFGLALRTMALSLVSATRSDRIGTEACLRIVDRCLEFEPTDGEGCVAIAEQCAALDDDDRAMCWLLRATRVDEPPPRAFENLGVLHANAGDLVEARSLWQRGLDIDGHPDFFAHLARLAFEEGRVEDGWDRLLRGVWRLHERRTRAAEWDDASGGAGVLLRYLAEHLRDGSPPADVRVAAVDLIGLLDDPGARVELGLCLVALGYPAEARVEIDAGLNGELALDTRDRGVRALLAMSVSDFEARFAKAVDVAMHGRDPRAALAEMQLFVAEQPEFWPALFFAGIAMRRLDRHDDALELVVEASRRVPGQPDVLSELGLLFDLRGNAKRALECIDEALAARSDSAELHARRARFLDHLGRAEEARESRRRARESRQSES